ncbi:hypothetical protein COC69_32470 [Bacillus cereus]|uniref:Uncharacterized protein n=1 Tax=Bacillus cereus TaxID=1396 RepID=A0A9X7CGL0_BACCE|nr:hypothetical protein [Bacillus cereus]PGS62051.1 hypothetical protein COC69_32470 [Bacillus cereus]
MKRAIEDWRKSLEVEKRKRADYQFKRKQLKEHDAILVESIEDVNLTIRDMEEALERLEELSERSACDENE